MHCFERRMFFHFLEIGLFVQSSSCQRVGTSNYVVEVVFIAASNQYFKCDHQDPKKTHFITGFLTNAHTAMFKFCGLFHILELFSTSKINLWRRVKLWPRTVSCVQELWNLKWPKFSILCALSDEMWCLPIQVWDRQSCPFQMRIFDSNERCCFSSILKHRRELF